MTFDASTLSKPAARPAADPAPVERIAGDAPVIVVCDHAGNDVPAHLGDLGVPAAEFARHIGYDIGAAEITRAIAAALGASAVLCHVSRLVIDVNRDPRHADAMPVVSDGTVVPGNRDLDPADWRWRVAHAFVPYHRAVARQIAGWRRRGIWPALVSAHTCTPALGGVARPWQVGVMWNEDGRLPLPMLAALYAEPGLVVGDNLPYSGRSDIGYTVPFHAERAGLPNVAFEVRQDLVTTADAARAWGRRLAQTLREPLANNALYRPFGRRARGGHAP